jgi:hypothetical protein
MQLNIVWGGGGGLGEGELQTVQPISSALGHSFNCPASHVCLRNFSHNCPGKPGRGGLLRRVLLVRVLYSFFTSAFCFMRISPILLFSSMQIWFLALLWSNGKKKLLFNKGSVSWDLVGPVLNYSLCSGQEGTAAGFSWNVSKGSADFVLKETYLMPSLPNYSWLILFLGLNLENQHYIYTRKLFTIYIYISRVYLSWYLWIFKAYWRHSRNYPYD